MEETSNRAGISTGLAIGLMALVVLILAGGVYAYVNTETTSLTTQINDLKNEVTILKTVKPKTLTPTPTPTIDETATWKTYTNTEFGFTVKYPSTYSTVNASNYTANDGVMISESATTKAILFSVEARKSVDTLDADVVKIKDISGEVKTTLAESPAYEGINNGIVSSYEIVTKQGSNIIEITMSNSGTGTSLAEMKAALTPIQKQILSTLQFTK